MNIYFCRFTLEPVKALNRLSSKPVRQGVFLKAESPKGRALCEYFPHTELGDPSVDEFLETFSQGLANVQKKAHYLLDPYWIRSTPNQPFYNHSFSQMGKVVKYKIQNERDLSFIDGFPGVERIRLDANGLFNQASWEKFYQRIPIDVRNKVEYIEDPLSTLDWNSVDIACASDFINGSPAQFIILKPYRDFYPDTQRPVIFSGNMGHGLSNYQSYLELIDNGDLSLFHGILTPNLYENTPDLFIEEKSLFRPDPKKVETYLNDLFLMKWSSLCTMP